MEGDGSGRTEVKRDGGENSRRVLNVGRRKRKLIAICVSCFNAILAKFECPATTERESTTRTQKVVSDIVVIVDRNYKYK